MKVVELLTGLERFVRLCVERMVPGSNLAQSQNSMSSLNNDSVRSPKVFGLPKPYTGLYSASSYMANRPSYMRTREPGQYTITSTSSSPGSNSSATPSYSKLPGVSGVPGMNGELKKSYGTLPGSRTLPDIPRSRSGTIEKSVSLPRKSVSDDQDNNVVSNVMEPSNPDQTVKELMARLPPAPTKVGVATETVTKTTFSETTVKRVTNNTVNPLIVEVS